jgi:hypothetical protein
MVDTSLIMRRDADSDAVYAANTAQVVLSRDAGVAGGCTAGERVEDQFSKRWRFQ